jgi:hypothetical protein
MDRAGTSSAVVVNIHIQDQLAEMLVARDARDRSRVKISAGKAPRFQWQNARTGRGSKHAMLEEPAMDNAIQGERRPAPVWLSIQEPSQCENTIFTSMYKSPPWAFTCAQARVFQISPIRKSGSLMAPRRKTFCLPALWKVSKLMGMPFGTWIDLSVEDGQGPRTRTAFFLLSVTSMSVRFQGTNEGALAGAYIRENSLTVQATRPPWRHWQS